MAGLRSPPALSLKRVDKNYSKLKILKHFSYVALILRIVGIIFKVLYLFIGIDSGTFSIEFNELSSLLKQNLTPEQLNNIKEYSKTITWATKVIMLSRNVKCTLPDGVDINNLPQSPPSTVPSPFF